MSIEDFKKIIGGGKELMEEAKKHKTPEEQKAYDEALDNLMRKWQSIDEDGLEDDDFEVE